MTHTPSAPAPQERLSAEQDNQWASLAHLGGILSFLPALIIWLVFKNRASLSNTEGKEALNFQIVVLIGQGVISVLNNTVLPFATLGFWGLIGGILPLALWVVSVIFCIQGFIAARDGRSYRYPLTIRFLT